jgi:uncharacterized membrane protein YcaP (DUF421 family)
MKEEEIKLNDWERIFLGEVPPEFFIEVIIRMTFLYLLLIFSMRLLGHRMASQLSRNEIAALVSLAAAIGVPILAPDRGLVPALVIALVVVTISKLLALGSYKSQKVESVVQGKLDTLVKDAVLNIPAMTKTRITRERIMAQLRSEKIKHLGEVQRLYLEANGNFTLVRTDQPKPGLTVLPETDPSFIRELKPNGVLVCYACGLSNQSSNKGEECPNCKNNKWVVSVEVPS